MGKLAFDSLSIPSTIQVGHYLPLKCGHNGNLSQVEKDALERHFVAGKVMEDHRSDGDQSQRSTARNR